MRPVRIWHQSVDELEGLDAYRRRLVEHARAVLGDDAALVQNIHDQTGK